MLDARTGAATPDEWIDVMSEHLDPADEEQDNFTAVAVFVGR
jgi:hypothetical protein